MKRTIHTKRVRLNNHWIWLKAGAELDEDGFFEEIAKSLDLAPKNRLKLENSQRRRADAKKKKHSDPIDFVHVSNLISGNLYNTYDCNSNLDGAQAEPSCRKKDCPNRTIPSTKASYENCYHVMNMKNHTKGVEKVRQGLSESGRTLIVMIR